MRPGPTRDRDRPRRCAVGILRLDDLTQSVAQPTQPRDIERHERVDALFHPLSHEDRARLGVGERCAVAKELGHHVQIVGQPQRAAGVPAKRQRAVGEKRHQVLALGAGHPLGVGMGGVQRHEMRKRGPRGALPAFVEPHARDHPGIVGAPDPGHEGRLGGRGHGAGRGAEHVAEAVTRRAGAALGGDRADPARMGVDQARRHGGAGPQPHLRRRSLGQPPSKCGAGQHHRRPDPGEALVGEIVKADGVEIVGIEAPLVGEVGPLAGERAGRPVQRSARLPGQEIRQIEELLCGGVDIGPVLPEPQQLRRLHLGRDPSADIFQHVVIARVDPRRLPGGAMVHPDDDIALRAGVIADGQAALRADHHERAGGIETDARHPCGIEARDRFLHRGADRVPDLRRALLDEPRVVAVHGDVALGGGEERARAVEDTRPCRARAHVDADEEIRHGRSFFSGVPERPDAAAPGEDRRRRGLLTSARRPMASRSGRAPSPAACG